MNSNDKNPGKTQQYNLKWTNYTSNLLEMFAEQFAKEAYTDVTLACEGKFIHAHKMVLSACSPYFEDIFSVYSVPQPLIIMNGIEYNLLKILIDFMYLGEVRVSDGYLNHLLELAEHFQVKGLSKVRKNPVTNSNDTNSSNNVKNVNDNEQNINQSKAEDDKIVISKKKRKITNGSDSVENNKALQEDKHNKTIFDNVPIKIEDEMGEGSDDKIFILGEEFPPTVFPSEIIKTPRHILPANSKNPVNKFNLKIRRPQNAFMIFANKHRKEVASENPSDTNKDISVRLGNLWKSLSLEKKESYYKAAKLQTEEHKKQYPGYYYSPKEARIRKNLKNAVKQNRPLDAIQLVQLVMPESEHTSDVVYTVSDCEVDLVPDENN